MKIVGLLSCNYTADDFGILLDHRPLPSLPIGGRYRLVDFALSNLVNSGLTEVGLVTPYYYRSLMDHIGDGKEWSLSRKIGGLYILPGSIYGFKQVYSRFLLLDLKRNRAFIDRSQADAILFTAASNVCNIDYRPFIKAFEESGAEIMMMYKPISEPCKSLLMDIDADGKVKGLTGPIFESGNVFADCFLIRLDTLKRIIDGFGVLDHMDLCEIFAENMDKLDIAAYAYNGYMGMVTSIKQYMKVNNDLLDSDIRRDLFAGERKILTKVQDNPPAKYMGAGTAKNSLVSSGCIIEGTVENSVLFRDVHVHPGAVVKNCVIMQHGEILENASLDNVICDKYVTVSRGAMLAGSPDNTFLIGKGQRF